MSALALLLLLLRRPALLPLLLGLSLGCSLGLLRVSWSQGGGEDSCVDAAGPHSAARRQQGLGEAVAVAAAAAAAGGRRRGAGPGGGKGEEFRPRIVPYYRDPPNKASKKVLR